MDIQSEFNNFYKILEQTNDHIFFSEIIYEIDNSEVLFQSKAVLETSHAYRIYKDRFEIQEEITMKKTVEGYQALINNLSQEASQEIYIYGLTTQKASFIIFVSSVSNRVIGILKSMANGMAKKQQLQKQYMDNEFSGQLFYKRKLI